MQSTSSWDAIVVGAGPAGAVVAYLLACNDLQVLLLEARRFPRTKVCGGCLNPRAINALESIGLGDVLRRCEGESFDRVRIHHDRRWADVPLPPGQCVTRGTLDFALVEAAVAAGATFVAEARCKVLPVADSRHRQVQWNSTDGITFTASAPIVLACDGVGHPSLHDLIEIGRSVVHGSRIGVGALLEHGEAIEWLLPNSITMAVGDCGYVGLARAECKRVSIAAALDPAALGGVTSPEVVLRQVLDSAGLDSELVDEIGSLRGTPPITQHATGVAAERLLLVGDAAGYVEPFTGEGMAAAIEGAMLVAPLAREATRRWSTELTEQWQADYTRHIRSRQLACRSVAWLVRHPRIVRWSLAGLSFQPRVGAAIGHWIGRTKTPEETSAR